MNSFFHPEGIKAIKKILNTAGIDTYITDKEKYPVIFEKTPYKFVVDSSIKKIHQVLENNQIAYHPGINRKFVTIKGPVKGSQIHLDFLPLEEKKLGEELIIAIQNNLIVDWLYSLKESGLLKFIFPEIYATVGIDGGPYHSETIFDHLINSLKVATNYSTKLKLAILLHDIGKPAARKENNNHISFHNHEILGTSIAYQMCNRLCIDPEITKYIVLMIRHHMFRFDSTSKKKTIKRWLYKVGKNNWHDLFKLRIADRQGNSNNKYKPLVTKQMKQLQIRIDEIIKSGAIIFKEDINITEEKINRIKKPEIKLDEIYTNLIGLINSDKTRNNITWLSNYIRKVYR